MTPHQSLYYQVVEFTVGVLEHILIDLGLLRAVSLLHHLEIANAVILATLGMSARNLLLSAMP